MPNTLRPFNGQCVKIYEDTGTGKYVIQVDNAVGTGTTLSTQKFADSELSQFNQAIRALLPGVLIHPNR